MAYSRDVKVGRIVVKLSGSVFGFDLKPNALKPICSLFAEQSRGGLQPIVVAGGGVTARHYISLARSLGADEATLDELGIEASRLNARLLVSALGELCDPAVPHSLDEVVAAVNRGRIVVSGGLHPGHSTNAVAALIAERVRAKIFVNATDVDGVYDADPNRDKAAKKFKTIGARRFTRLLAEGEMAAGTYELMDLVALKIIERSKIPTVIVKCSVKEIQAAIEGKDVGTSIDMGD